jgi:hypothetical protein
LCRYFISVIFYQDIAAALPIDLGTLGFVLRSAIVSDETCSITRYQIFFIGTTLLCTHGHKGTPDQLTWPVLDAFFFSGLAIRQHTQNSLTTLDIVISEPQGHTFHLERNLGRFFGVFHLVSGNRCSHPDEISKKVRDVAEPNFAGGKAALPTAAENRLSNVVWRLLNGGYLKPLKQRVMMVECQFPVYSPPGMGMIMSNLNHR